MKKYVLYMSFIITLFFLNIKCVSAYSVDNYKDRNLCGNYELASFKEDGSITKVDCFTTFEEASKKMKEKGTRDLAIMSRVKGKVKILDANVGLLDLSVNPTTLTYFYRNSELKGYRYTYMDTGSLYGGTDGAILETKLNSRGIWTAKVRIGNCTSWISEEAYEVVPITWVKSKSSYTITNESIRHNYVDKIQLENHRSKGSTIGPKPDMLEPGTYYSYDGHYFYKDVEVMIKDYRNNTYENSVNKKDPYYNYYMYLSNHTRTTYSSLNIDEYIRTNMNIKMDAYGNKTRNGSSRLYGKGQFFYYAQEKFGVNALLSLSLSRNETSHGRSELAIVKNNGFGLNAVDRNPIHAANWYPSFANSILGYASKYITYGYMHPRDSRYFGPQFGDKGLGMNVNYASDTYWSEKMAAQYYSFDRAKGLQDYNYYQLGVVKDKTSAMSKPTTKSKFIYEYPEKDDALLIVDEVDGELYNGSTKWYKVMSDLNIDENYNEIKSGNYNWNGYVYVPAGNVLKINKIDGDYKNPNDISEFPDKNYIYDLYDENSNLKPKIALSTKNTNYYYDSALQSKKEMILLKDKYVMVYATAYLNNKPVSHLVTSDYFYDQKEWVPADSIKFISGTYGHVNMTFTENRYTWVNSNRQDIESTKISGLFTNSYVPVLEQVNDNNNVWYKVPVSLTSNYNSYGWTLAKSEGIEIKLNTVKVKNTPPIIKANDKKIIQGTKYNIYESVTAYDDEDKDLTNQIKIKESNININVPGMYKVTYYVKDKENLEATKTINVEVIPNQKPIIYAKDREINLGEKINLKDGVTAYDEEDKDVTNKIEIIRNNLNINSVGTYKVVYKVTDSYNQSTTKEINIKVLDKEVKLRKGEFYLHELKWNNKNHKYEMSGYLIILNSNNNDLNPKYTLILENKNNKKKYETNINPWMNNVPYSLGKENNYDYSISWFKDTLDLENIPSGDYNLYMKATKDEFYSIEEVTNLFNKPIKRRMEYNNLSYNFIVQLGLKSQKLELNLRHEKAITVNEAPTFRNMINNYENIKFINNKLNIFGTSYNYGATYNNPNEIKRELILEDINNYKQYKYDIGSTNKGTYKVLSNDKKNKDYAWYNNTVDISNLPVGTYSMIIHTKTKESDDYGEISDTFASINEARCTIGNKIFEVKLNKQRYNRIEIVVRNK